MTGAAATVLLAAATVITQAEGGTYVLTPTSRPVLHSAVFQSETAEKFEDCPGCLDSGGPVYVKEKGIGYTNGGLLAEYGDGEWPLLAAYNKGEMCDNGNLYERDEISARHGICGDPKQFALESTNAYSGSLSDWSALETLKEGGVLDIKVVVAEYLGGHLEFFICNSADIKFGPTSKPNQECFNMNPLTRAEGDDVNSPIDPAYPGRYYVNPPCHVTEHPEALPDGAQEGYVINMQYQLPEGLTCDHCVLQMVHYTGNTCKHVGYDDFEPESWPSQCAPTKAEWINTDHWMCGMAGAYPEEHWSCSDISITTDGPTEESPSPVEPDTPPPVSTATPAATPAPTEALGANEGGGDGFSFSYSYDYDDSDDGGYDYDEACLTCERASLYMTPADWATLEDEGLELVCDPDCLMDEALEGCAAFGLGTACRTIPLVVEPVFPGTPAPVGEATPAPQAEAAPTPRLETPSPVAMMTPPHSDGGDSDDSYSGSSSASASASVSASGGGSSDDSGGDSSSSDDSGDSGNEACAKFNEQCGGQHYTGTTCCEAGLTCKHWTDYWSSCRY
ncbi:unnamed protein product [Ectocarpus sp. 6 AP-2014]